MERFGVHPTYRLPVHLYLWSGVILKLGSMVIEVSLPVIWTGLKLMRFGARLNGHDAKITIHPNKFGGIIVIQRCKKA